MHAALVPALSCSDSVAATDISAAPWPAAGADFVPAFFHRMTSIFFCLPFFPLKEGAISTLSSVSPASANLLCIVTRHHSELILLEYFLFLSNFLS